MGLARAWPGYFLGTIVYLAATAFPGIAAPGDPENYTTLIGGALDIPENSVVEGSAKYGGLQPDYLIDSGSPHFSRLFALADRVKEKNLDWWEKVRILTEEIRDNELPGKAYNDADYLSVLSRYRSLNADIPLSRYLSIGSGVCRENALILHLALKRAGIPSYHAYVTVRQGAALGGRVEDHAIVIAPKEGKLWVVDSYNSNFNGYLLEDLLEGKTPLPVRMAPFSDISPTNRKILAFNRYPRVWIPKSAGTPNELEMIPPPKYQQDFLRGIPRTCHALLRSFKDFF